MATQTIKFEYDPERNLLFAEDDFEVNTPEDADLFVDLYREQFEKIGRPVNIVARVDGLYINDSVRAYYGNRSRPVSQHWCLNFARYGSTAIGRMNAKFMGKKAEFETAVYQTREEAAAAVISGIREK
ncbi:hypothetical protein HZA73_11765 [candidate division TA06 bacterium]|nr:hypothetical protein [candidate division TA06 bacterium]